MNITRILFNTKLIALIFLIAIFAVGIRSALAPMHIIVHCDHKFPLHLQLAITKQIEQSSLRTLGAKKIKMALEQEYQSVKSVTIAYKGSLDAIIEVGAYTPWIRYISAMPGQAEYIYCKEGIILEKKYFNEMVTEGMASIIIEGADYAQKVKNPDLMRCSHDIKHALFGDYAVLWRSKVEILLRSHDSRSILIADAVSIHEDERFEYVNRILKSEPERYEKGIKADIRLRDALICSPL